jgi:hypothetical protein
VNVAYDFLSIQYRTIFNQLIYMKAKKVTQKVHARFTRALLTAALLAGLGGTAWAAPGTQAQHTKIAPLQARVAAMQQNAPLLFI